MHSSNDRFSFEETENSIKCNVPVTNTDLSEFGFGITYQITNIVLNFVSKKLLEHGVEQNIDMVEIHEMIKNSCDSFVSKGHIEKGKRLEFLVNIKCQNDEVVVKFKDNGVGLDDMPGKLFNVPDIVKHARDTRSATFKVFGGKHLGLERMNNLIKEQDGSMQLKKRKNGGCAVYVRFKVFGNNKAHHEERHDNAEIDKNEKTNSNLSPKA